MADLEAMLESAPQDITEIQAEASEDSDDREERLTSLACAGLDKIIDDLDGCDAAQVEKVILHLITDKMIDWHSRVGHRISEEGDAMSAMGWLRDAGKFQSIANILATITVGPEDFTAGATAQ